MYESFLQFWKTINLFLKLIFKFLPQQVFVLRGRWLRVRNQSTVGWLSKKIFD